MPTQILGINVPDFNGQGQEICHSFTGNFLLQRANHNAVYNNNIPNYTFLQPIILAQALVILPIGTPIQAGDIVILGVGRNPNNGDIITVSHSMVVINNHTWFGTNNLGTFGLLFQNANINPANLQHRRAIDLVVLGIAIGQLGISVFNQNNYTLQRPAIEGNLDVCVYR